MSDTPAGWYDDPEDATQHRYWDGTAWTEHRAPKYGPARTQTGDEPFAVISRSWELLRQSWAAQLAFVGIALIGIITAVVMIVVGVGIALDPAPWDILDRIISDNNWNPDLDPRDRAYLDAITWTWHPATIMLFVVGIPLLYVSYGLGFAAAQIHVAGIHHGARPRIGETFGYSLRQLPRWIGIALLWSLVSAAATFVVVLVYILAMWITPVLLVALIPATIAGVIYAWPYLHIAPAALVLAPRGGPFRQLAPLIKRNWGPIAVRVLLVNAILFAVNLGSNVLGIIPVLGLVLAIPLAIGLATFQICTNVVLYEYVGGPVDPAITTRQDATGPAQSV